MSPVDRPTAGASLSAARRSRELAGTVGGPVVDVLVVGLGATGAGAALDAAARGLSVAAVDAHDLAFGTSRWSSKLIHGGLRYLASAQLDVAHESAVERGVLMERTAPHLVRAQPFVLPLTPWSPAARGRWRGPGSGPATPCGSRRAPRGPRCPRRGACPPWRPVTSRPRCARTGCAAACCPGTAGSPTTPGW